MGARDGSQNPHLIKPKAKTKRYVTLTRGWRDEVIKLDANFEAGKISFSISDLSPTFKDVILWRDRMDAPSKCTIVRIVE